MRNNIRALHILLDQAISLHGALCQPPHSSSEEEAKRQEELYKKDKEEINKIIEFIAFSLGVKINIVPEIIWDDGPEPEFESEPGKEDKIEPELQHSNNAANQVLKESKALDMAKRVAQYEMAELTASVKRVIKEDIKIGDWVSYDGSGSIEKGIVVKIWDDNGILDSYICFVPKQGLPYVLRYYLSSLKKI
jgi:hypothetical protein